MSMSNSNVIVPDPTFRKLRMSIQPDLSVLSDEELRSAGMVDDGDEHAAIHQPNRSESVVIWPRIPPGPQISSGF